MGIKVSINPKIIYIKCIEISVKTINRNPQLLQLTRALKQIPRNKLQTELKSKQIPRNKLQTELKSKQIL